MRSRPARPPRTSSARSAISPSTSAPHSSCASSRAARTRRSPRSSRITVSAVETLIFRARRALREQLDGSLTCLDAERRDLTAARRQAVTAGVAERCARTCANAASARGFARSQRAQRVGVQGARRRAAPDLAHVALRRRRRPRSGPDVALKAAAVVAAGVVATGAGYEGRAGVHAADADARRRPSLSRRRGHPCREVAAPLVVAAPVVKHVAAPKPAAAAKKPVQSARRSRQRRRTAAPPRPAS